MEFLLEVTGGWSFDGTLILIAIVAGAIVGIFRGVRRHW